MAVGTIHEATPFVLPNGIGIVIVVDGQFVITGGMESTGMTVGLQGMEKVRGLTLDELGEI